MPPRAREREAARRGASPRGPRCRSRDRREYAADVLPNADRADAADHLDARAAHRSPPRARALHRSRAPSLGRSRLVALNMPDRRPTPEEYAPHQESYVSLVDGPVLDMLRAQESEIATLPTFI